LGRIAHNAAAVDEIMALCGLYEARYKAFRMAHFYDKYRANHQGTRCLSRELSPQLYTAALEQNVKKEKFLFFLNLNPDFSIEIKDKNGKTFLEVLIKDNYLKKAEVGFEPIHANDLSGIIEKCVQIGFKQETREKIFSLFAEDDAFYGVLYTQSEKTILGLLNANKILIERVLSGTVQISQNETMIVQDERKDKNKILRENEIGHYFLTEILYSLSATPGLLSGIKKKIKKIENKAALYLSSQDRRDMGLKIVDLDGVQVEKLKFLIEECRAIHFHMLNHQLPSESKRVLSTKTAKGKITDFFKVKSKETELTGNGNKKRKLDDAFEEEKIEQGEMSQTSLTFP
jgi:hypothetical protein